MVVVVVVIVIVVVMLGQCVVLLSIWSVGDCRGCGWEGFVLG